MPIAYDINFSTILCADEWRNFLARIGRDEDTHESELADSPSDILELRFWASYRGQTLARTGMIFSNLQYVLGSFSLLILIFSLGGVGRLG